MPSTGNNTATRRTIYDPLINPTFPTGLWESCPLWEYMHDPSVGRLFEEQWDQYDVTTTEGEYLASQATSGTAAISTAEGGVLEIDSGAATATQGINLQHQKAAFVPAAGKDIWAEFDFKIVDTFDKVEIFVGLSELDTAIIDTSANASVNHIGWQCVTDDGVLLATSEKATAGATKAAATIAEATNIRLGFFVSGVTSVQQYIDGVSVGAAFATANIPIVALYPSFVCQSGGTNDPIMHLRGYRIFQLR